MSHKRWNVRRCCVGPSGRVVPCDVRGVVSAGWTVHWTPHELGLYTVDIEYGHSLVVGSPFTCKVFDVSKVVILRDQHLDSVDDFGDVVFYGITRHVSSRYLSL